MYPFGGDARGYGAGSALAKLAAALVALAALAGAAGCRVARSPPRREAPSRVPMTRAAIVWSTQPWPSCQCPVTRSAMWPGFLPVGPVTRRRESATDSVSTGPKAP